MTARWNTFGRLYIENPLDAPRVGKGTLMAASIEITPDLLAGFFDEAAEHLEALNRCLLAFEKDAEQGPVDFGQSDAAERMNETFRVAHSLQRLTGVFRFDHIN